MSTSWRRPTVAACLAAVAVLAASASASAAPPAPDALRINEVESTDPSVLDFVELINNGPAADIGGYVIKDNDDTHAFTLPAGTTIAAGGYYVADTDAGSGGPGFGLGSADSARLFAPGGAPLVDSYSWTAHAVATTYGRCPNGTGVFTTTAASTRGAANSCGAAAADVKINEVESERSERRRLRRADQQRGRDRHRRLRHQGQRRRARLHDPGGHDARGRWLLRRGHRHRLRRARIRSRLGGLGAPVRAGRRGGGGRQLQLDGACRATTYGRCPNGTGAFTTTAASTRGAANVCPGDVIALPWPGGSAVATADGVNVFGTNLSGLAYQPSGSSARGVLWAVRNSPSTLYRLVYDGTKWTPDTTNGWSAGKQLQLPRRQRRSGRRGRDPRRRRPGQRDLRLHRARQPRQLDQPPRRPALRRVLAGHDPQRDEGLQPDAGPSRPGTEPRPGGHRLDGGRRPRGQGLAGRAHRRGVQPGELSRPRHGAVLRRRRAGRRDHRLRPEPDHGRLLPRRHDRERVHRRHGPRVRARVRPPVGRLRRHLQRPLGDARHRADRRRTPGSSS